RKRGREASVMLQQMPKSSGPIYSSIIKNLAKSRIASFGLYSCHLQLAKSPKEFNPALLHSADPITDGIECRHSASLASVGSRQPQRQAAAALHQPTESTGGGVRTGGEPAAEQSAKSSNPGGAAVAGPAGAFELFQARLTPQIRRSAAQHAGGTTMAGLSSWAPALNESRQEAIERLKAGLEARAEARRARRSESDSSERQAKRWARRHRRRFEHSSSTMLEMLKRSRLVAGVAASSAAARQSGGCSRPGKQRTGSTGDAAAGIQLTGDKENDCGNHGFMRARQNLLKQSQRH
uniref:IENR2 domain-containing protein n=1 Tax=Macrostomum lignano TaxID=282301 RepID=A0A1I8FEE7_9PLAT